jgi:hypothetical protein
VTLGIPIIVPCPACEVKPLGTCFLCDGKGYSVYEDDLATDDSGCTCPQGVRDTGSHSVACPCAAEGKAAA